MNIKKMAFYVPVFALVGTLSFASPNNTIVAHAQEEEEVLYEEQKGGETQEKNDESTKVENTPTSVGIPEKKPEIVEADADNNQNQAINADPNQYLDNSNYYPATDPSSNPGEFIPEGTKDEVDIKFPPTPPETPPETPPVTPPPTIPKMGADSEYDIKILGCFYAGLAGLWALYALIKRVGLTFVLAKNRAEMEELDEAKGLKVVDTKRKFKVEKKGKILTLRTEKTGK